MDQNEYLEYIEIEKELDSLGIRMNRKLPERADLSSAFKDAQSTSARY